MGDYLVRRERTTVQEGIDLFVPGEVAVWFSDGEDIAFKRLESSNVEDMNRNGVPDMPSIYDPANADALKRAKRCAAMLLFWRREMQWRKKAADWENEWIVGDIVRVKAGRKFPIGEQGRVVAWNQHPMYGWSHLVDFELLGKQWISTRNLELVKKNGEFQRPSHREILDYAVNNANTWWETHAGQLHHTSIAAARAMLEEVGLWDILMATP